VSLSRPASAAWRSKAAAIRALTRPDLRAGVGNFDQRHALETKDL
jgi:hypothetical protein